MPASTPARCPETHSAVAEPCQSQPTKPLFAEQPGARAPLWFQLPLAILMPLLLGISIWMGVEAGVYSANTGFLVCNLLLVIFPVLFVFWSIDFLARADANHAQLKRVLRSSHDQTAQLEAANRELQSFSYSVSHDLRAPLRSIEGFSSILQEEYADKLDEQGRHYLSRVRAASLHMGQLIDALLQLSRVTRGDMHCQPVDLSLLARAVMGELLQVSPGRKIKVRIAGNLQASGDARLLQIAFRNLLGNAFKFSSGCERAEIEVGSFVQDDSTVFFVRDNGVGFEMEYAHKLFQPFQRLHSTSEFEGTGIGLATVQRIINRHGGRIWAEGKPGEGATVYFTLPS